MHCDMYLMDLAASMSKSSSILSSSGGGGARHILFFICVTSRAACPPYMYPQCVQREGCFLLQGRSKLSKKMQRRPARLLIELIDWAMEERNPVAAEAFFPAFPLAKWCNNVPKWLHIRNGNVCTQCVQLQ